MAWPIWRRLQAHLARLAVSRALDREGRRIEISRAMIPMTTSSSTSVKPRSRVLASRFMVKLLYGASRAGKRVTDRHAAQGADAHVSIECNDDDTMARALKRRTGVAPTENP